MTDSDDNQRAHELDRARQVYRRSYQVDWRDVSYRWHPRNPAALAYRHEREEALARLLDRLPIDLPTAYILDVGCGYGALPRLFLEWGADPARLYGVDLAPERLAWARRLTPGVRYVEQSADRLPFPADVFDMVCQFTLFSSILDAGVRRAAAAEIGRVLQPGGLLLWFDIDAGFDSSDTRGIALDELRGLFPGYGVAAARRLHHRLMGRFAGTRPTVSRALSYWPWLRRTNLLVALTKPAP